MKPLHAVGMPSSSVEFRFPANYSESSCVSSILDLELLRVDDQNVLVREILASHVLLSRQDHFLR